MNTYLLLGRTGDLCAVLPFLKKEDGCRLVVSNQHSNLLEGVSYVDCVPFDGGIHLLKEAYEWSKAKFGVVKSLQVIGNKEALQEVTYGPTGATSSRASSFMKEMWRCAGRLDKWDDFWPLVFDKRNKAREEALYAKYCPRKPGKPKKLMLVFTESHSSPFKYKRLLLDVLKTTFSKSHNIVENPQAERLFDLLGLYEKADVIVSVDSAPLHLARAVPRVTTIALTNDDLWKGTPWQPNHTWYSRYGDFPNRAFDMVAAIDSRQPETDLAEMVVVWPSEQAIESRIGGRAWFPISYGMASRDATSIGDKARFPALKDCLHMAMQRCRSDGVVCITRENTHVHLDSVGKDPCFAYRIQDNVFRPIVDLFSATKVWWKDHLSEIPDYVFGKDHYWSHGLWALFKKYHAADNTGIAFRATHKP